MEIIGVNISIQPPPTHTRAAASSVAESLVLRLSFKPQLLLYFFCKRSGSWRRMHAVRVVPPAAIAISDAASSFYRGLGHPLGHLCSRGVPRGGYFRPDLCVGSF